MAGSSAAEVCGDDGEVWDLAAYGFLDADCPPTANPSLWRQSRLAALHGLFAVTEGIYQVRGFDLSNMTIVEGDSGVLVIDPLISTETAAAVLAPYRRHRGDRRLPRCSGPGLRHCDTVSGAPSGANAWG